MIIATINYGDYYGTISLFTLSKHDNNIFWEYVVDSAQFTSNATLNLAPFEKSTVFLVKNILGSYGSNGVLVFPYTESDLNSKLTLEDLLKHNDSCML